MKKCPACGREFRFEMPFCPDCGENPQPKPRVEPAGAGNPAMDSVLAGERSLVGNIIPVMKAFFAGIERATGYSHSADVKLSPSSMISTFGLGLVSLPVWATGPEEIRKLYLEWTDGDEALARRWFDLSFYWFYYVHELGHSIQDQMCGVRQFDLYESEMNANEWATAFWYSRPRTTEHDEWEKMTDAIIAWGVKKGYPEDVSGKQFKHHASCEIGYYGYQEWKLVKDCYLKRGELTYEKMVSTWAPAIMQSLKGQSQQADKEASR
jgi:hypothetical protein